MLQRFDIVVGAAQSEERIGELRIDLGGLSRRVIARIAVLDPPQSLYGTEQWARVARLVGEEHHLPGKFPVQARQLLRDTTEARLQTGTRFLNAIFRKLRGITHVDVPKLDPV